MPPHTKSHHPFFPLRTSKSRRNMNPVFFNAVTPSRINTNDIFTSLQVRFLIVWSRLNYFPVQQLLVTNSMHVQSTNIPHLQHLQSGGWFGIQSNIFGGAFLQMLSTCWDHTLFSRRSSIVDAWQDSKCDSAKQPILLGSH